MLSLKRKRTSRVCNKNSVTRGHRNVIKQSRDLRSCIAKVEKSSNTLLATPSSQDVVQVEDVANGRNNNVKRNLFGTLPMEDDELAMNKSTPLPCVNFSFHSPVKGDEETVPDTVSIHDSVSSALHQLPPLGDGDIAMIIDDNQYCDNDSVIEDACNEDDQWLENISSSAWEGQLGETNQEMGGANPARVLRRFVIQSVLTRQRMDPELQSTTSIPRYSSIYSSAYH